MLSLKSATHPRWVLQVQTNIEALLIDHAHCEKKAAATAMNLLFAYVDQVPTALRLAEIVEEELAHFRLVLNLLESRGIRFKRIPPSQYGHKLSALIDKQEPRRAIDRLLVAGLIEARSCERFALLRDSLPDKELAEFYGSLFESEARHHATYVQLALQFGEERLVRQRLDFLAEQESAIIAPGEPAPRVHS